MSVDEWRHRSCGRRLQSQATMRRKGYLQGRRRLTGRQRRQRHRNGALTHRSGISDCKKAAERSAEPSQKQTVKSPEQKEQVEHAAEPAEACGTQLERVPNTDSSDNGQVGDEVHRTGQWKALENDGEELGALEHYARA